MTSQTATQTEPGGEWIMPAVSYVEPMRVYCALCGRPIARKHWVASPAGERLPFCDPAHEALYREYWLPTYAGDKSWEVVNTCSGSQPLTRS